MLFKQMSLKKHMEMLFSKHVKTELQVTSKRRLVPCAVSRKTVNSL